MKYKRLYVTLGILIIAAAFWKGCWSEDTRNVSAQENETVKRQRTNQAPKSRIDEILGYVERGNVPIRFYGRVVDENGAGLEGVSVGYRIRRGEAILGALKVHNDRETLVSAADGTFEISKRRGSSLEVGPFVKDGYRDAQRDPRSFGYMGTPEPHSPEIQNPVQFIMVKDTIPRTKEVYEKRLRFAWNQGEVRIPLGGKLGDFVLTPSRVMKKDESGKFDWNVKVTMDRAELASLGDYYSPIAPGEGYQSTYEYGTSHGDDKRPGGATKTYAFKTTDRLYGLIRLSIDPDGEDFIVNGSLDVRLNESGSRNLD